jgi:transcriptional regulator with XRE-family HTH domain
MIGEALLHNPDYAIAPGETLLEELRARDMSQAELAERTGRPLKTINEIVKGKTAITPETALQLEPFTEICCSDFLRVGLSVIADHFFRIRAKNCGIAG